MGNPFYWPQVGIYSGVIAIVMVAFELFQA
jgi:hypothetical protein